jgi:hypothetical protein
LKLFKNKFEVLGNVWIEDLSELALNLGHMKLHFPISADDNYIGWKAPYLPTNAPLQPMFTGRTYSELISIGMHILFNCMCTAEIEFGKAPAVNLVIVGTPPAAACMQKVSGTTVKPHLGILVGLMTLINRMNKVHQLFRLPKGFESEVTELTIQQMQETFELPIVPAELSVNSTCTGASSRRFRCIKNIWNICCNVGCTQSGTLTFTTCKDEIQKKKSEFAWNGNLVDSHSNLDMKLRVSNIIRRRSQNQAMFLEQTVFDSAILQVWLALRLSIPELYKFIKKNREDRGLNSDFLQYVKINGRKYKNLEECIFSHPPSTLPIFQDKRYPVLNYWELKRKKRESNKRQKVK